MRNDPTYNSVVRAEKMVGEARRAASPEYQARKRAEDQRAAAIAEEKARIKADLIAEHRENADGMRADLEDMLARRMGDVDAARFFMDERRDIAREIDDYMLRAIDGIAEARAAAIVDGRLAQGVAA